MFAYISIPVTASKVVVPESLPPTTVNVAPDVPTSNTLPLIITNVTTIFDSNETFLDIMPATASVTATGAPTTTANTLPQPQQQQEHLPTQHNVPTGHNVLMSPLNLITGATQPTLGNQQLIVGPGNQSLVAGNQPNDTMLALQNAAAAAQQVVQVVERGGTVQAPGFPMYSTAPVGGGVYPPVTTVAFSEQMYSNQLYMNQ